MVDGGFSRRETLGVGLLRTDSDRSVSRDGEAAASEYRSACVTAGIDLALTRKLDGEVLSQSIQLAIEYDPQPPHDSGNPWKAPVEIRNAVEFAASAGWSRRRESNYRFRRGS